MKKRLILFWMSISMAILLSSVTALIDDPIFYYSFDADDCQDQGSNNIDCYKNNTPQHLTTGCKVGAGCYQFDRSNSEWLSTMDDSLLDSNTICVAYWLKLNSYGNSQHVLTQVNSGTHYQLNLIEAADRFRGQYRIGASYTSAYDATVRSGNGWHWILSCYVEGDGHQLYYNNSPVDYDTSQTGALADIDLTYIGRNPAGNYLDGVLDEIGMWDYNLSHSDRNTLFNSGDGGTPFGGDVTPPSITNINQNPQNLTTLNSVEDGVIINATITDAALNYSRIQMNYSSVGIETFVNGINTTITRTIYPYDDYSGNVFNWTLTEAVYLSSTRNLPEEAFETQTMYNNTMNSANHYIKVRFYNVSNSSDLMFTEIQDDNSTGIAEYMYCNDGYVTGNPVSHDNCTIFFTQTGNDFIHPHGGRWHRLMTMPVQSGYINGVRITKESYILKRGSSAIERYYYLQNSTNSVETTNNNGNSWSTPSPDITLNMHIHQIGQNESIWYYICAWDNSSNGACSDQYNDTIDFPTLPPSGVTIVTPEAGVNYNNTIQTNWTVASSVTGQSIVNYTLSYRSNESSVWTEITVVNHPTSQYSWDITNRANGNYYFRVVTTDNLGLQSVSISEQFAVLNEESLNTQLLNQIDATLNSILEVIEMLPLIFLYISFLAIGFYMILNYSYVFGSLLLMSTVLLDIYFLITYYSTAWYVGIIFLIFTLFKPWAVYTVRTKKNRSIYI